jgi:hypothetical protein
VTYLAKLVALSNSVNGCKAGRDLRIPWLFCLIASRVALAYLLNVQALYGLGFLLLLGKDIVFCLMLLGAEEVRATLVQRAGTVPRGLFEHGASLVKVP